MSNGKYSLLAGRNQAPLSEEEIRRAINTFLGLDSSVNVRHEPNARTVFRVDHDDSGQEFGEIVFGPDIYPGAGVVDPNSALSLDAASAHELTHYHRWRNKAALSDDTLDHMDEALTSLEAILRYGRHLRDLDVLQLVSDALQRLQLYLQDLPS